MQKVYRGMKQNMSKNALSSDSSWVRAFNKRAQLRLAFLKSIDCNVTGIDTAVTVDSIDDSADLFFDTQGNIIDVSNAFADYLPPRKRKREEAAPCPAPVTLDRAPRKCLKILQSLNSAASPDSNLGPLPPLQRADNSLSSICSFTTVSDSENEASAATSRSDISEEEWEVSKVLVSIAMLGGRH